MFFKNVFYIQILAFHVAALWVGETAKSSDQSLKNEERFGHRQFEQMLDDLPQMREAFANNSFVKDWIINQYNSGDKGNRIHWDNTQPFSGRNAEHLQRLSSRPAMIRISKNPQLTASDKWCLLIFEFNNIRFCHGLYDDVEALRQGQLTSKEFAVLCVKHEFEALQETGKFLRHPTVLVDIKPTDFFANRYMNTRTDFDEYLRFLDHELIQGRYDPREYYRQYADQILAR